MKKRTTETPKTMDLKELIYMFKKHDKYMFKVFVKDIESCIEPSNATKRVLNAQKFIEIACLDKQERIETAKKIKNEELLARFFRNNRCLEKYQESLSGYLSLKEGFEKTFSGHTDKDEIEINFNQHRDHFLNKINIAEKIEGSYRGKHSYGQKKAVQKALTMCPIGAKEAPYRILYDLILTYMGLGTLGEKLPQEYFDNKYVNKKNKKYLNHPTFQGMPVTK